MKRAPFFFLSIAGLLCAANVYAQLYKSVGADGKITYSDTPPASARQIEIKPMSGNNHADALPSELVEAVKKNPVTLYSTDKCGPCNEGRSLLNSRGIPFSEKTVHGNDDLVVLRQAGGEQQLPLLTVGSSVQQGFEATTWHSALTAAGYPLTSKLPHAYQNPPALSAAPQKSAVEQKAVPTQRTNTRPGTPSPPQPSPNAAPGFRF
jgi:glutaredoxin